MGAGFLCFGNHSTDLICAESWQTRLGFATTIEPLLMWKSGMRCDIARWVRTGTKIDVGRLLTESVITRSAMPQQKNLRELFHDTLKDIYFAEKKY